MNKNITIYLITIIFLNFFCLFSCKEKDEKIESELVPTDNNILKDFPIPNTQIYPEINEDYGFVNQTKGLVLRSDASVQASIIKILPIFTMVIILDDNGPTDNINGISGNWFKVKNDDSIGWVFGPFLSNINNSKSHRDKPDFNNMELSLVSFYACCGCGGSDKRESITFINGKVSYRKTYSDESISETSVHDGSYIIAGDSITIKLNNGKKTIIDPNSRNKQDIKTVPEKGKTFSLTWNERINGFTEKSVEKYINRKNYYVNMNECQFFEIKTFVAYDLCLKNKGITSAKFKTDENEQVYIGFYCEKN